MWFRASLVVVAAACFLCAASRGQPYNGDFEIPDESRPNTYYDPNVYPPLGWDWQDTDNNKNYVGLHTDFVPQPEQGQTIAWVIPAPASGERFVLLSTGDSEGPGSEGLTEYSRIEQIIKVCPGDTLYGSYFFGTCDYSPYNDTGTVKASPVDPNSGLRPILLAFSSVETLGNFKSTDGWQHFQYTFSGETCGDYVLSCEIRDVLDRQYKSYLALDNFRICRAAPGFGDLNHDCGIDYLDLAILSQAWLADCNDPNVLNDPNIPCSLVIQDPNLYDNFINEAQLIQMSENWLEWFGYPE